MIDYLTVSVRLQALDNDRYEVTVKGPSGDGSARFELAFANEDLDVLAAAVSRPRSGRRRIESDESALAREFGERLFGLIFQDTARDVLRASLSQTLSEDKGLRLMLQLDRAPGLRNVPWELLWDRPKFISTSAYTPVLRYVDLPQRRSSLALQSPLRILGMISSPGDMPPLDTEDEQAQLVDACQHLIDDGLLEIEWVSEATLSGLLRTLNNGTYHIFHFMGHGDFDEQAGDGVLLFEGPAGRSQRVPGTQLGTILADHHTLRLAVVNACEGARSASDSSGVATTLMEYGMPAVIAMQFEISDVAAISFAHGFYASLAKSNPIDRALADARRGMFADGHGLEWATPVMFTSVDDCQLFNMDTGQVTPEGGAQRKARDAREREAREAQQREVQEAQERKAREEREAREERGRQERSALEAREAHERKLAQERLAGFWRRFWASMIDGFLLLIVYSVLYEALQAAGAALGVLAAIGYYVYFEGRSGQTLGKRGLGLRVVDVDGGGPIGFGRALVRALGRYVSATFLFVGYLTMISDSKKQCWHDKFAKSIVIRTR